MQKEELLQFIKDFYDNRLEYAIIYEDNSIYAIRRTEDLLQKDKGALHLLTYGGELNGQWDWKIHEYEYGAVCQLGKIEFFKTRDEAISRAQELANKMAQHCYLSDNVFKHWLDLGLQIPEVALERKNRELIEREDRLLNELQEVKKLREDFFKKYCK
jgi:hypothetical protein